MSTPEPRITIELTERIDSRRVTVPISPFLEALVQQVQSEHGLQGLTFGQALAWIVEDCVFVLDESVPAYGRWSPALRSMIGRAVAVAELPEESST